LGRKTAHTAGRAHHGRRLEFPIRSLQYALQWCNCGANVLRRMRSSAATALGTSLAPFEVWPFRHPGGTPFDSIPKRRAIMASASRIKWEGRWDQLKGAVKKTWGHITDDDLKKVEGDYDRTVGLIKERTGESMENIQKKLDNCESC